MAFPSNFCPNGFQASFWRGLYFCRIQSMWGCAQVPLLEIVNCGKEICFLGDLARRDWDFDAEALIVRALFMVVFLTPFFHDFMCPFECFTWLLEISATVVAYWGVSFSNTHLNVWHFVLEGTPPQKRESWLRQPDIISQLRTDLKAEKEKSKKKKKQPGD